MKHIKDNIQEITNAAKDIGETYAETGRSAERFREMTADDSDDLGDAYRDIGTAYRNKDRRSQRPRHQKSRQRNRTRIQKIWQTSRRYLPRFRRKMSHWATPFQTAHIQTRYARFSLHAAVFCYNREYLKKHEKEYTSMRPTILYITAGASSPWRTTTMARRSAYMYTTFNDPPVVV